MGIGRGIILLQLDRFGEVCQGIHGIARHPCCFGPQEIEDEEVRVFSQVLRTVGNHLRDPVEHEEQVDPGETMFHPGGIDLDQPIVRLQCLVQLLGHGVTRHQIGHGLNVFADVQGLAQTFDSVGLFATTLQGSNTIVF